MTKKSLVNLLRHLSPDKKSIERKDKIKLQVVNYATMWCTEALLLSVLFYNIAVVILLDNTFKVKNLSWKLKIVDSTANYCAYLKC